MTGQINDNIKGAMFESPIGDTSSIALDIVEGPEQEVPSEMSINDLLQSVVTVDGKIRVLIS